MQLTTRKLHNILVVKCDVDRLDAKVAVDFKTSMAKLINQGNSKILLDISTVTFIDSSALGAIVSSLKLIGPDGELFIAGAQDPIRKMFKLTRMDRVFRMFPTEEDALQHISD
ncbi:STAS domain-containing protein [Desulfosediminicola flagellatus]|uniref:STAS domain-containing protein n=1 Tax=Desulfosediminicola flagellatus TaxID=2569541 RepID=UPI0010AC5580|nr:STAS domain-containing protein [Desulfosediminicola flagellatus]